MTSPEDPRQRIADLEKQLADARRIADLERQLADARAQQPAPGSPGRMADLFATLQQVRPGVGGAFGTGFGGTPAPPVDTRLADAPRRVPVSFVIAEMLPFRWWYLFAMFMVAVPPIIVWVTHPGLVAPAGVLTLVVIYGFQLWRARTRLALVKWGRVAQVIGTDVTSRGTYYSGTTYSNVFLPQAHGWTVTRQLWSGPSTKTKVRYALDGRQGELTIKGRAYDDGVVLADQRHPERALCVSSFAYDLDRDANGNWVGRLRGRLKVGMVVWLLVVVGWLALTIGISTGVVGRITAEVFATRIDPGGSATVTDADWTSIVYCNDGHLTVDDASVTVRGHCASLDVSGVDGVVTVDSVDTITLSGIDNHVVYHSGTPKISGSGINNVAVRG